MCMQKDVQPKELGIKQVGKYLVGEKIGGGSFGTVHLGVDTQSKERVAVKQCLNDTYKQKKMLGDLENELRTMKKARGSKYVLDMRAEMRTTNNTYIVMELCEKTLLEEVLKVGSFDAPKTKERMVELLRGVLHLHDANLAHRDLKPENIMIGVDGCAKIGDFGFARQLGGAEPIVIGAGTAEYLPAEAVLNKGKLADKSFDFKAGDMWACGIICYAMLTGRLPFSREQVKAWRSPSDATFEIPTSMDAEAADLIRGLTAKRPADRLTAEQALSHPFLRSATPRNIVNEGVRKVGRKLSRVIQKVRSH